MADLGVAPDLSPERELANSTVDPPVAGATGNKHLAPVFTPGNFELGTHRSIT